MRVRYPHRITRLGAAPSDVPCFAPSDMSRGIEFAFGALAGHPAVLFWPKPKGRRDAGDEIKANIMFAVISAGVTIGSAGSLTPIAGLIAGQVIDNGGIFVWDVLGKGGDLSRPADLANAKAFVQSEAGKIRADQIRQLYQAKWGKPISDSVLKKVCATKAVAESSLKVHIDANPPAAGEPVIGVVKPDPFKSLPKIVETKPPPELKKLPVKDTPKKSGFPWWLALVAIPFL